MTGADAQIILFTLATSLLAVALSLPLATLLAWLLARRNWSGKSIVETIATLPLVMPPVATGLVLLTLLGKRGPVGSWLFEHLGVEIVFTAKAVVIALAVMVFPLLLRSIRTAFEEIPRIYEDAASNLGGRPLRVFFKVTLPLARRGLTAGILLSFARALGEFGATVMIAGFIPGVTETLPLAIYRSVQIGDDSRALWLAGTSATIAFVATWISASLVRRQYR
jgi:molybdate transport system permease protein